METLLSKLAHYQEVYTKGAYQFIEKPRLKVKFYGKFFRFETHQDVIPQEQFPDIDWVSSDDEAQADLHFYHEFDRRMTLDGFSLEVSEPGKVVVTTKNLRGFRYALEAFHMLLEFGEEGVAYPLVKIKHEVSFQMRGVIEGFYGVPWQHSDRLDLLHFLGKERLNTYMYAPKDDQYQRKLWRELYSDVALARFSELLAVAEAEHIDFYYMISPGNDIDYTLASEVAVLTTKLQQLIDIGVRHFGLLLDDIDYILKGNAKRKFSSSASAHAFLISTVDAFLGTQLADYRLVACPTEYDNHHDSLYLEILNRELPKDIPLFWTGPATLATEISTAAIETMANIYERPLVIWDNVPVNDYQKDYELLFLSPYENRSPKLANDEYQVVGIVSNPMAQWELSKLTVHNMSQYLWNSPKFEVVSAWDKTLLEYAGSEYYEALKCFAKFNPNKYTREQYSHEQLLKIRQKDQDYISDELAKLHFAGKVLAKLPNEAFQANCGPWLKRIEMDVAYWQVVLAGNNTELKRKAKELADYPHRLGTDLVQKYVEYWQLLAE
ncbi:beta-N-acetylglucosaminidase domain-containing protein [Vagococcus sp. BWB3-3]|uniref:Beta-N-acetylglucosaminidase domain-containing protein n=1 Tax=Vagococcus allomyrinae TaxID=2794353 RepID=A0A940SVV9_9ENTE|nr:beta-N-acetylglucosaminidase domain-containing protein [Vagococcus allomyrinae]